jgi:signal transduction histidine kinase
VNARSGPPTSLSGSLERRFLPKKLQHRIGLVLLIVVLLFFTNFFIIKYHLDNVNDDAYITDAIGRQRMLTARIGYNAERAVANDTEAIEVLRNDLFMYSSSLAVFRHGGAIAGVSNGTALSPLPSELSPLLDSSEEIWNRYRDDALIVLANPKSPEAFDAMNRMELIAPSLVEKNDELVKSYTTITMRYERLLLLWTIVSLLSSTLVIIIFYMGTNRHLITPLQKLKAAAEEIERGKYDIHLDIDTGDELDDLATAFNKAARQLVKIEHEHQEIDKAKVTFLTMSSHELRSPMTPLKAQLQMLLNDYFGKLNKKQRESAIIALRNAEQLDIIILDMLELSRIEAAKISFTFTKTDLDQEVKLFVKGMKGYHPEKHIKLEINIPKMAPFECDAGRITQVLRNLLTNAIKFSDKNGVVRISVKDSHSEIVFSVKDSGRGMNDDTKARLFEPFYQEDNIYGRQYGGTGLGLPICKGIVEMMGGRIWFESEQGKGATFHFSVPKTPPQEIRNVNLLLSGDERWKTLLKK